jgi:beta-mannanase
VRGEGGRSASHYEDRSFRVIRRVSLKILLVAAIGAAFGLTGAQAASLRQAGDPSIAFTTPADSAIVSGILTVSGTAQAVAGVARVEVRVDDHGYVLATGTTTWSLSIDTAAYPNGAHDLKARVTDATGRQAWSDLAITFSNAVPAPPPQVRFTAPHAGSALRRTTTVRGTAADGAGVGRVDVRVDQGPYKRAAGFGRWSLRVDTTAYGEGKHELTARVTDISGRRVTVTRRFVVDNRPKQIYWGALVSGHLYGYGNPPYDMRSLRAFERHAGKKVSILALGANWGAPHSGFPLGAMKKIRAHGSIPFYSWASMANGGADQPKYAMSRIINGAFDGYIRRFALAAKAWGHPFFLRFDWEMNLQNWYPWIETVNGNKRGDFVKMWRHVHDIFTSVGATNVTWVWCPNAEYSRSIKPLRSLYPGGAYVDWTCVDGYNWGENPWRRNIWQTFTEVIGPTYKTILDTVTRSKPMMIGETASSEYGGSKAGWITDMLSVQLPRYFRHVQAFIWFNELDKADWQIETSAAASNAFRAAIRSSYYAGADFGNLVPETIRPLTP